jgi:hypothetical protein
MSTIMHETTIQHPAWCNASECVAYESISFVEHRTIPRPLTMKYVTASMFLSGWAMSKDDTPDHPMVYTELEHTGLLKKMRVMLSPAEARTFATALLDAAETADRCTMSAETVHEQIDRKYGYIADYIATATTIRELSVLHEGTFTVPMLVGVELRRRIDVRGYALGARG